MGSSRRGEASTQASRSSGKGPPRGAWLCPLSQPSTRCHWQAIISRWLTTRRPGEQRYERYARPPRDSCVCLRIGLPLSWIRTRTRVRAAVKPGAALFPWPRRVLSVSLSLSVSLRRRAHHFHYHEPMGWIDSAHDGGGEDAEEGRQSGRPSRQVRDDPHVMRCE